MKIPKNHPRKKSLKQRHALEKGLKSGIVTPTGMIAFGRGEALDYLLGEKTTKNAKKAARAAASLLLLSEKPAISVNGNACMLCAKEIIKLAETVNAQIEANTFYPPKNRKKLIALHFAKLGKKILGVQAEKKIRGLASTRAIVEKKGIFSADTVLVAIEDGDRTEALKKNRKKVIAIDLNPKSRTALAADVTIVDNVVRAFPQIILQARKLKRKDKKKLQKIVREFDNKKNLKESLNLIKQKV